MQNIELNLDKKIESETLTSEEVSSIAKSVRDTKTVESTGVSTEIMPYGLKFHPVKTHCDDRGNVCEMYDIRWNFHPDPVVFSYFYTIRPGVIKGWGLHKEHDDRYFLIQGEMEVIFYDVRPESPTYKQVSKVVLSEFDRKVMNIPKNVWHANRNIGTKDAIIVNFPTICYDHSNPDKYRLPLDTDQIPYKFHNPVGW